MRWCFSIRIARILVWEMGEIVWWVEETQEHKSDCATWVAESQSLEAAAEEFYGAANAVDGGLPVD